MRLVERLAKNVPVRRTKRTGRHVKAAPASSTQQRESTHQTIDPDLHSIAGFRVLRRIATGERVDVFLGHAHGSFDGISEPASGPEGFVAALRVFRPDVAAESISAEIEAMSCLQEGLPRLSDVATLDDGRTCLVVERLGPSIADVLARRRISAGEAVTLCAPIVVTVDRLHDAGFVLGRLSPADVLLDHVGRPTIAGLGALRRLTASELTPGERFDAVIADYRLLADFIEAIFGNGESARGREIAAWLRSKLSERPFEPCAAELERRVFAVAQAEPLRTELPGSSRALPMRIEVRESTSGSDDSTSQSAPASRERAERRPRPSALLDALGIVPADSLDRLGDALDAPIISRLRARCRALFAARRRSFIVGASVCAAVLVVALSVVPPGDAPSETAGASVNGAGHAEVADGEAVSDATDSTGHSARSKDGGEVPTSADTVERTETVDPAVVAAELIGRRHECLADLSLTCLEQVVQPGSPLVVRDSAEIVRAQHGEPPSSERQDLTSRESRVVGDLGTAVIVEFVSSEHDTLPASALIVRGENGWRLREVFGG